MAERGEREGEGKDEALGEKVRVEKGEPLRAFSSATPTGSVYENAKVPHPNHELIPLPADITLTTKVNCPICGLSTCIIRNSHVEKSSCPHLLNRPISIEPSILPELRRYFND